MTVQTDIKTFLEKIGLSDKEVELYICSLQHGPQSASTFSKRTGIARSTVNFIFDQLIQKGFASKETQERSTYFSVVKPESIEYILLQKQAESKKNLDEFQSLLPLLNQIQNQSHTKPHIQFFEGVEGLCRMVDDSCAVDQKGYFISGHQNMHPKIRDYVKHFYLPKVRKQKHKKEVIFSDHPVTREYLKNAKGIYEQAIFVDPKDNPFKVTLSIYGNKVAFLSYDPQDLSGVIIENEMIAEHMKALFQIVKTSFAKK